jgi:dihydroorotate dehydrogenase (fumarate)
MADLSCSFLGLTLKSPIIVECKSSEIEELTIIANSGPGALILKPLIEEEIISDSGLISDLIENLEAGKDINRLFNSSKSGTYLSCINQLKNKLNIPIIASIDCFSYGPWIDFVKLIEYTGADAIQLSVFSFPDDKDFRSTDYEKSYLEIATKVTYDVKIPVYLKITPYFTNLLNTIDQLFYRGIQGVAVFDNFGYEDIDIDEFEFIQLNNNIEQYNSYFLTKWLGIISSIIRKLDIAACCNSINRDELIKYLLSGANAIILSQHYQSNPDVINELNTMLLKWMDEKGFSKIEHFHSQMNYQQSVNPAIYERELYLKSKRNSE